MELSRQSDYAVRAVIEIASHADDVRVQTGEIARRQEIPNSFLPRIIASLSKAKLIRTYRGIKGGVALARPATEISLLDIVQAVEGSICLNRCSFDPRRCNNSGLCPVHPVWRHAQNYLNQLLANTKIADLISSSPAMNFARE